MEILISIYQFCADYCDLLLRKQPLIDFNLSFHFLFAYTFLLYLGRVSERVLTFPLTLSA